MLVDEGVPPLLQRLTTVFKGLFLTHFWKLNPCWLRSSDSYVGLTVLYGIGDKCELQLRKVLPSFQLQ
jgi:hypothetical protein